MRPELVSALLAVAGYSILNVSQAVQKIGLHEFRRSRCKGAAIWTGALLASGVSFLVVFGAVAIGNVSVVGAMAGTGLVALTLFSWLVMGERIGLETVVAIGTIVAGAACVALFPGRAGGAVNRVLLWAIPAGVTVAMVIVIALLRSPAATGPAIAALAGFLGAYSQLFQKIAAASIGGASGLGATVVRVVQDPYTAVWIALSAASMVVVQFAYRHADAIRIVPVFTATFIVTPVVGGVVVMGEVLSPAQWTGVGLIVAASVVFGRQRHR